MYAWLFFTFFAAQYPYTFNQSTLVITSQFRNFGGLIEARLWRTCVEPGRLDSIYPVEGVVAVYQVEILQVLNGEACYLTIFQQLADTRVD
jgi:hypothetical protein